MIDLHSHILPGVDDGSDSVEMSCAMLRELQTQGVETVVATPHFYALQDTPEAFLQRRTEAAEQMAGSVENAPQLLLGAEIAYFDGLSSSEVPEKLQIENTGLVLVEMPFAAWTPRAIREICQMPAMTGLTPVLAHIDRYRRPDQFPKYRDELLANGALFQCNAEAFLPRWDRRWALQLFRQGCIHFLGTDAHNMTSRKPCIDQAAQVIRQKLGMDLLDDFCSEARELLKR